MRISPEVVADVDHGSKNREPETRTHEQRELNEDSAAGASTRTCLGIA
jgi:hypothetical protein